MERSLTHKWSKAELIQLVLSCMYKIYYMVMIIVAIFHMPLQHKFQMLSQMRAKVIGPKCRKGANAISKGFNSIFN